MTCLSGACPVGIICVYNENKVFHERSGSGLPACLRSLTTLPHELSKPVLSVSWLLIKSL